MVDGIGTLPRKKLEMFLAALRERGVVGYACKAAKVARSTMYAYRERHKRFAAEWDDAIEDALDAMETEGFRRAVEGVEEGVFQQGAQVGIIRKYSDGLLKFMLAAKRPKVFSERIRAELSGPDGGPVNVSGVLAAPPGMSLEEWSKAVSTATAASAAAAKAASEGSET